jgi:hypothetical protein
LFPCSSQPAGSPKTQPRPFLPRISRQSAAALHLSARSASSALAASSSNFSAALARSVGSGVGLYGRPRTGSVVASPVASWAVTARSVCARISAKQSPVMAPL